MTKYPYAGPDISEEDVEAVVRAVRNGFYENYRRDVSELEAAVANEVGSQYAVAVNSGSAAILVGLLAVGVGPGDEVISADSSCVASAMPILHAGATPVLVDVQPSDWCISPDRIRDAVTSRTRAIVPVHWNGHPAPMSDIMEIAREYDLAVVEDAAAALGSLVGERHVGSIGDVGCFSFQGAKVAIAGQGGVVVTNDASLAERARCISSYGRTDSVKPYWSDHVGWNFGLANLPAALAASQLKRLSTLVQHKREIAATYSQQLDSVQGIRFVREPNGARSNYAYPIAEVLPGAVVSRDELLEGLKIWGVDARPAQPRISDMPMFEARFSNTVSRHAEERGIILPSAHRLSIEQIVEICGIVRGILHET